jgi:hypothetical protein
VANPIREHLDTNVQLKEHEIKALSVATLESKGRCHSCMHCHEFTMPSRAHYWCRVFDAEMTEDRRNQVKNCPEWRPLQIHPNRHSGIQTHDPGIQQQIDREDFMFWRTKKHLERAGLDLKTMMVISNPAPSGSGDLAWLDDLDSRFNGYPPGTIKEVLEDLRALSYISLAQLVEQALR